MKHQCYRSHNCENKNILFKAKNFASYNVFNNKSLNSKILAGLNWSVRTYLDNKSDVAFSRHCRSSWRERCMQWSRELFEGADALRTIWPSKRILLCFPVAPRYYRCFEPLILMDVNARWRTREKNKEEQGDGGGGRARWAVAKAKVRHAGGLLYLDPTLSSFIIE